MEETYQLIEGSPTPARPGRQGAARHRARAQGSWSPHRGDGRWLTKSLDETESAFKGRYQPKAWRGALPSLRLRDLSAGE